MLWESLPVGRAGYVDPPAELLRAEVETGSWARQLLSAASQFGQLHFSAKQK